MTVTFAFIVLFTLVPAAVAMALRNLIHSALLLIASWAGIAAFYLWAGAEFVAFAQVLVYVGAVSMIVLFAVLLTRHMRNDAPLAPDSRVRASSALVVGGATLWVLAVAVTGTRLNVQTETAPQVSVKEIGTQLAGPHAAALLIAGVLLTVALLGGIVLAAQERNSPPGDQP